MVLLIAAALAASNVSPAPQDGAAATVLARATVRIISGVRVHFSEARSEDAPPLRVTTIQADGVQRPARLIEFE